MIITIHKGSKQVGGSSVEVSYKGTYILIDLGLPLDFDHNESLESVVPDTLKELTDYSDSKFNGLLLSHAHLDHYGLISEIPPSVPVYCGAASAEIMKATTEFVLDTRTRPDYYNFQNRTPFSIGGFRITPYLIDHSAFDAYAFLVEAEGKSIFYTGDFRAHGRKAKLFDRLVQNPPHTDVLLMEGTLIGDRARELFVSESELEGRFADVMIETRGLVFVSLSSQNIDRLVSVFRAAKRTDRMFIIDFYTAEILSLLEPFARIPQPEWPRIWVCYPRMLAQRFEKMGLQKILEKHRSNGIKWTRINEIRDSAVMLVRPGFVPQLKRFIDLDGATWVYSMWPGYFDRSPALVSLKEFFNTSGVKFKYLHTSGHATVQDMKRLVDAMKPKTLVPVHSFHPEKYADHFENVTLLNDGEEYVIE